MFFSEVSGALSIAVVVTRPSTIRKTEIRHVATRSKYLAEHEGRGGAVDEEIMPLDDCAEGALAATTFAVDCATSPGSKGPFASDKFVTASIADL